MHAHILSSCHKLNQVCLAYMFSYLHQVCYTIRTFVHAFLVVVYIKDAIYHTFVHAFVVVVYIKDAIHRTFVHAFSVVAKSLQTCMI